MLATDRRRIIGARRQCRDDRRIVGRVAKTDGEIARPSLITDPPNGAARHARLEFRFGPLEKGDQVDIVEP
jgi:hypothetical protein